MVPYSSRTLSRPFRSRVSPAQITNTPISTRIIQSVRHKSCPICLGPIETRKAAVIDICMHAYCIDCIRKWSRLKRTCPLCNSNFDRWFFNISVSTKHYSLERLPDSEEGENALIGSRFGSSSGQIGRRSMPQTFLASRSRDRLEAVARRSRPLPWRRSFGESRDRGECHPRVLDWRASVYKKGLQAVPIHLSSRGFAHASNGFAKERVEQRIRPWIERELKAILGDSDPSVIVHLATSLWILSISPRSGCGEAEFVERLRPFLHDRTDMFWHELKCFAECSLNMEAYDSVVEYRRMDS